MLKSMIIGLCVAGLFVSCGPEAQKQVEGAQERPSTILLNPSESKESYVASTEPLVGRRDGDGIFYKEFLKNPAKFRGVRLKVVGRVLSIEEVEGNTVLQIFILDSYDSVIARYKGSVDVYQDDRVKIYGEGRGAITGQNRMGAEMSWPIIEAQYVENLSVQSTPKKRKK